MPARAIAYPTLWRTAAALLVAVSRASALALLALLAFSETDFDNPLRLARVFGAFCLVPGLAAWLIGRMFAVTLVFEGHTLVLLGRELRIEIPCPAIDGVVPWTIPLPTAGLWLQMKSGRRLPYGLYVADPVTLVETLVAAGAAERVRDVARHPAVLDTRAKSREWRRGDHPLLKFPIFALVPTLPLFRLHQWIAYGGTFGEYYTYGLQAYLIAFALYWSTVTIYLVLYAALLRGLAEGAAVTAAWTAPTRAARVRQAVEHGVRLLYYGGVPLWLIRLYLSQ